MPSFPLAAVAVATACCLAAPALADSGHKDDKKNAMKAQLVVLRRLKSLHVVGGETVDARRVKNVSIDHLNGKLFVDGVESKRPRVFFEVLGVVEKSGRPVTDLGELLASLTAAAAATSGGEPRGKQRTSAPAEADSAAPTRRPASSVGRREGALERFRVAEAELRSGDEVPHESLKLTDSALRQVMQSELHSDWTRWLAYCDHENNDDVVGLYRRAVELGLFDWDPEAETIRQSLESLVEGWHAYTHLGEYFASLAPRFANTSARAAAGSPSPAARARLAALGKPTDIAVLSGPVPGGNSLEPIELPLHELYEVHQRDGLWHAVAFWKGARGEYAFRSLTVQGNPVDAADSRLRLTPEELAREAPEETARHARMKAFRERVLGTADEHDIRGYGYVELDSANLADVAHDAQANVWTLTLRDGRRYRLVDEDRETGSPTVFGRGFDASTKPTPAEEPTVRGTGGELRTPFTRGAVGRQARLFGRSR